MRARLLAVGVVVPLVFVVVLMIEGLTRPGYNSRRDMGSLLSTGPGGWMQIVNFIACGLLITAAAAGLARSHAPAAWGPRLIAIFGLSLVIAGAFTTDPANGYPPGTPAAGGPQTWHGTIHDLNAFLAFGSITAAAFVFGRAFARDPRARAWARYSYLTAAATLLLFAASLTAAVLGQSQLWHNAPGGFLQRLAIIVAWGWLSLLSLRTLRSRAGAPLPIT
jgi:uncharacterized protein DUF998